MFEAHKIDGNPRLGFEDLCKVLLCVQNEVGIVADADMEQDLWELVSIAPEQTLSFALFFDFVEKKPRQPLWGRTMSADQFFKLAKAGGPGFPASIPSTVNGDTASSGNGSKS